MSTVLSTGNTKTGKGFPYSTSSVGPGADPGVQAVRWPLSHTMVILWWLYFHSTDVTTEKLQKTFKKHPWNQDADHLLYFTSHFPGEPGSACSPSTLFLHLVDNKRKIFLSYDRKQARRDSRQVTEEVQLRIWTMSNCKCSVFSRLEISRISLLLFEHVSL